MQVLQGGLRPELLEPAVGRGRRFHRKPDLLGVVRRQARRHGRGQQGALCARGAVPPKGWVYYQEIRLTKNCPLRQPHFPL